MDNIDIESCHYKIISKISEGGFGIVYLVHNTLIEKDQYVYKYVKNNSSLSDDITRGEIIETNILFGCECPFLLKGEDILTPLE